MVEKRVGRLASLIALGGFLFGFDAPVISGVVGYISSDFVLSDLQIGLVVGAPTRWCSVTARLSYPQLTGRESPGSLFEQSLVATRMTDRYCSVETCVEFNQTHFQAMAGLMIYYNSRKFHYLYISHEPGLGKVLNIMSCLADYSLCNHYPQTGEKILLSEGATFLRFDITETQARAAYKEAENDDWRQATVTLDTTCLTDQAGMASGEQFTGTFVGMAAHDVSGHGQVADFSYFAFEEAP